MTRWTVLLAALLTVSGCTSVPPEQTPALCPTELPIGVPITVSGKLSSDGIHGVFLRPDMCPAKYFMLNKTAGTVGFEKVNAAVYGEHRIGTAGKIIQVTIHGSLEGSPLSIRVIEVRSVDVLSAATHVR